MKLMKWATALVLAVGIAIPAAVHAEENNRSRRFCGTYIWI